MMEIGYIKPREITREMQESYLDYAMSVIISRALPDVRDGLKPVHRRILYAMWEMGLKSGAKFRKSAAVVGDCLGKYHPHGDIAVYDSLVRLAQDFNMRYPLITGQGNFGCFTKDTKVKLTDGRNLSFEELINEHTKGRRNYTYTINGLGLISIAEIKKPWLTRKKAEIIKVTFDNNEEIKCTPNHLFMLRDGSYKKAKDLKPNDSLMPLYQKMSEKTDRINQEGYVLIYQNKTNKWIPVHHLADNYNLTIKGYKKSKGRVRHHLDFNRLNNNPDNIVRMHWKEHWQIHYQTASTLHKNPEYRQKIAAGRNSYWSNPLHKEKHAKLLSKRNIKNWQNPEYREKMRRFLSEVNKRYIQAHPEKRKEFSKQATKTLKDLWQNPEYRLLMHEKIIKGNKNHITNKTGKLKFLNICKEAIKQFRILNKENYALARKKIYSYGAAPLWETGLNKYFQNNPDLIRQGIDNNHKVIKTEKIEKKEDVYDLTINKTHNFCLAAGIFVHNSIDGDSAAAQRYTEAKLSKISEELLYDLDKETVKFIDNYDATQKEPRVLPAKLPNVLLNGTMGIAVGMATNIPPHNLGEITEGIIYLIDHKKAGVEDLAKFIKGPDFPTGGFIFNKKDILQVYAQGKGAILMRGRAEIVENKKGTFSIIISEIPYQVNKAQLVEKIAQLVHDKKLEGIRDVRDESDKEGIRVVVDLKREAFPKKILNRLYHLTSLQEKFHVNMLALVDGLVPRVLNLKSVLEYYIKHRQEVVKNRTQYELKRARERAHILEGLKKALDRISEVIKTIRQSKTKEQAGQNLVKKFRLTKIQAQAILEMKLSQLAALERKKIEDELKEKRKLIKELGFILASPKKIFGVVKSELQELKKKYADERKTKVVAGAAEEFTAEDLIPKEDIVITLTHGGYIKSLPQGAYKSQGRGGKGVKGMEMREEDVIEHCFVTDTHSNILFFTNSGKVFQLKAYEIPKSGRAARGQSVVNFLQLAQGERITALVSLKKGFKDKYLAFVTKNGLAKKVNLEDFKNVRHSGLIAIKLKKNDELRWVKSTSGQDEIILVTAQGQSIRFKEKDIRAMGRAAAGVRGVRIKGKDEVIGMDVIENQKSKIKNQKLLIVTENGFGKKTALKLYKIQRRGGSGIKTAKVTAKNGKIVFAKILDEATEEIIVISRKGQVIRVAQDSISEQGRATQGVHIMRLKTGDRVASVAYI